MAVILAGLRLGDFDISALAARFTNVEGLLATSEGLLESWQPSSHFLELSIPLNQPKSVEIRELCQLGLNNGILGLN